MAKRVVAKPRFDLAAQVATLSAESLLPPHVTFKRKGRPKIEDKDKTAEAAKPWIAAGMSRRSWYRREAEKRGKP
jgi:hypothetical protein